MDALTTKASLLSALTEAARTKPSADELQKQRISFIMSAVKENDDMTESRIKEVLAEQEGSR